jgi:hypothetical protein
MKISKRNDLKFRTECTLLVLCENAFAINETLRNGNYRIEGEKNSLELMFYENTDSEIYCVFCKFDKPVVGLGNQWSGKHNFHTNSDMNEAINEFKLFFKNAVKHL